MPDGGCSQGWFPLAGLPWIPPCFAFDSVRPPPTFWAPSPNAHLLVMSLIGYVYMGPVPNGSKWIRSENWIKYNRPSAYRELFWNQPGTDPKLDLLFSRSNFGSIWIHSGPVRERSCVNRNCSSPVPFGTVPVQSSVNVALVQSCFHSPNLNTATCILHTGE